jgi:hypothetical protein
VNWLCRLATFILNGVLNGAYLEMQIEPYSPHQLDAVIRLSLRAWNPVFDSIQKVMDAEIYRHFFLIGL